MRKGKVSRMQLICNEKGRRRQFEKRKTSLQKAATDLSTLCGVDIGMVVFGPKATAAAAALQDDPEEQPTLWNQQVLTGLMEAYKARLCHDSRTKTYNLSDFFKEKTEKMKDDLDKLRFKFNFKSPEEARLFHDALMAKLDAVRTRINVMKGSIFPNNSYYYYNPPAVQESVWKYEQQQQQVQPNFVYYSNDQNNNNNNNNNNNQMMTGYNNMYGGASNGGVYNMFDDQNNYATAACAAASNYGTYGTGMNTNYAKPQPQMMMSYNDAAGSCYLPPPKIEQQMLALDWFSPDGSEQKLTPAQWFLNNHN